LNPGSVKVRVREAKALEGLAQWADAEHAWHRLAMISQSEGQQSEFRERELRCAWAAKARGHDQVQQVRKVQTAI